MVYNGPAERKPDAKARTNIDYNEQNLVGLPRARLGLEGLKILTHTVYRY